MTLAPEGVEECGPVPCGVVVGADLVEDVLRASLGRRESFCIGVGGVEAECRSQCLQQILAQSPPVVGIAEGVRQLEVVDELVAVDPSLANDR